MGKKQDLKKAKSVKVAEAVKPARKSVAREKAPKATKSRQKKSVEPVNPPLVAKNEEPLVRATGQPMRKTLVPEVVSGGKSTIEPGDRDRYSDLELEEFKAIIKERLKEAVEDYNILKQTLANTDNNGTHDTDSASLKLIEDGSETMSREDTARLASRQEKFIKNLEDALVRIRNKRYGICRVTGKLISKERLRLVPHATLSVEGKQKSNAQQKGSVTGGPVRARLDAVAA